MKEALKKTWLIIVLALIVGASSGVYLTTVKDQKVLRDCESMTSNLESRIVQFCSGTKLMKARIATVKCNEVEEICVCGDPKILDGAM
jgi:hypothetical protein|tara:strand:- start:1610 stop:1873 length:264 start_codon:yes stop_codon:yes gene_type:complete